MTRFISLLIAAALFTLHASAQITADPHAAVSLKSDQLSVSDGETVTVGLEFVMDPDWHIYWRNPGDAGLPPQIVWDETSGAEIAEFEWPIPEVLPVVPGQIMDYGYSDTVIFPFDVTLPDAPGDSVTLSGKADYLICKDVCIPERVEISLTLAHTRTFAEPPIGQSNEVRSWRKQVPTNFEGASALHRGEAGWTLSLLPADKAAFGGQPIRFFPHDHHIVHSAAQPASYGEAGACLALTEATDGFDTSTIPTGIIVVGEPNSSARKGYTIAPGDGALLPGTCTARPDMPVASTNGIGSSDYTEGSGGEGSKRDASASGGRQGAGFSLMAILPFAFLGGLVLNLMPCVLPVLSIKALGMTHAAANGHANELKRHGLAYTAGVVLSFAALAGAFLAVRSALGTASLGFQLQSAPTVIILTLIVFVIGLWMMGMFELGTSIQNTGAGLAAKQGMAGAFFTGVLAAIVGAPCVGPFLGASLGAVIDQPATTVVLTFLILGFGMALPFLLLSFLPGLQKWLPKPGAWMETLKQFFAFPMFLTASWLLYVLGRLTDSTVVGWTIAGAAAIAFGIWVWNNIPKGKLRPVMQGVGAIALVAGTYAPIAQAMKPPPAPITKDAIIGDWSPDYVEALLNDGHGVFVDFTAAWCVTCQANKATTLSRKDVKMAFAENNVAFLTADFTKRDPVIAEELARRQRPGVPMYLYYPPGAREPQILPEILTPGLVIGLVSKK